MTGPVTLAAALAWSLRPVGQPPFDAPRAGRLGTRVLVVSPHLDDAVLSLGATLAGHVRAGGAVTVLTALAGMPGSATPAGDWDAVCGFATEGAAARARRAEDLAACRWIGAEVVHLGGSDDQYETGLDRVALAASLAEHVVDRDEVLLPGYPLRHGDHRRVAAAAGEVLAGLGRRYRLYAEQPYASFPSATDDPGWAAAALEVDWGVSGRPLVDQVAKVRALGRYRSQLAALVSRPGPAAAARALGEAWSATRRGEWFSAPVLGSPADT